MQSYDESTHLGHFNYEEKYFFLNQIVKSRMFFLIFLLTGLYYNVLT